jgi:hypothetical protein
MKAQMRISDIAIASALVLGILADQIVRVDGRPGVNVALWAIAGAAILWLLSRRRETPVSRETKWLVVGAVAFASLLMLRDAEALAVFCLFSAIALLGLAAGRGALAWASRTTFVELAASAVRVGVLIAMGPLGWSVGNAREPAPAAKPRYGRMIAGGRYGPAAARDSRRAALVGGSCFRAIGFRQYRPFTRAYCIRGCDRLDDEWLFACVYNQ